MSDELTDLLKQLEDRFGIQVFIDDEVPPLLTNSAGIDFVQRKTGVPLPMSRFDKDKMTGRAPPPDAYYGRAEMRRPVTWLRYVMTLLTSERVRLPGSRSGQLNVQADRGA